MICHSLIRAQPLDTHRCCIAARQHLCMCIYSLCTYIYMYVVYLYTHLCLHIFTYHEISAYTDMYVHVHIYIIIHIFQPNPDPDEVINPQEPRSRDSPMLREDGWFYRRFSNEDFPMKHSMDWWETLQETRIFPSWNNGVSCESFPWNESIETWGLFNYFKVCLVFDIWGGRLVLFLSPIFCLLGPFMDLGACWSIVGSSSRCKCNSRQQFWMIRKHAGFDMGYAFFSWTKTMCESNACNSCDVFLVGDVFQLGSRQTCAGRAQEQGLTALAMSKSTRDASICIIDTWSS